MTERDHQTGQQARPKNGSRPASRQKQIALACAVIFLATIGVRVLHLQDNRHAIPFYGMTGEYKAHALVLVDGDLKHFLRGPNPPSDANVVKHPPGYPLLMAAVYRVLGISDAPLQLVHIVLDAAAALLVFFIALELFPFPTATMAGLLVAFSPQLAYHSIALVPDPLAAPPILLAILLLVRARKQRLLRVVAAGALVGVSCWLRSNAMLLPFFLAAVVPFLLERGFRLRYAAALVGTAFLVIAPVTIRNAVVFRSFIPLSLSAGITLIEGIGAYDTDGRFGLPSTDYGVTKWEAREYNRPDYLETRFAPDGVDRERRRIARGLLVARQNPGWFLGVMIHRAASMLRLARVELVSTEPAVTNSLAVANEAQAAWAVSPAELRRDAGRPAQAILSLTEGERALRFKADGAQQLLISQPLPVRQDTDYLLRLPLKIEEGSVVIAVVDPTRNTRLTLTPVLHPVNWRELTREQQPSVTIERPFVSGAAETVRIVINNGGRRREPIAVEVGQIEAFALGPASYTWTRFPRLAIRGVQKLFLTALMLPLAFAGAVLLVRARRYDALAVLLIVPVYYMCVQSPLWTEFRYVLTLHYLLFILSAAGVHWVGLKLWQGARQIVSRAQAQS